MSVFDSMADSYERYRKPRPQIINSIVDCIERASLVGRRILDIGCGTGGYASKLGEIFGATIYGVDSSDAMLISANKKQFVCATKCNCNEPMDLSEKHFGCVYSINFIHYVKDLGRFFFYVNKLLEADGLIYIATHTEMDIQRQSLGHYFPSAIPIEISRIRPIEVITSSLSDNSFTSIKVESVDIEQALDEGYLDACKTKAYSCLHNIDEESLSRGIMNIEKDIKEGVVGHFPYTVVTGIKHD
jgi:ubiquinone/menaquinone biosynthesis C-methylase UbiE